MVGKPYRTGGAAPVTGFDCSGLVQFSFRQAGVILPRSTGMARQAGARVRVSHLRHGDLLFFRPSGQEELARRHLRGRRTIRAPPSSGKRVRKDRLDSPYWEEAPVGGAAVRRCRRLALPGTCSQKYSTISVVLGARLAERDPAVAAQR